MKLMTKKICSLIGLISLVVLGIHFTGPVSVDASMSRPLTRAEMSKTLGTACDCDDVQTNTDDCDQDGCPGCYETALDWCPDEDEGTGNSRDVCVTNSSATGLCTQDTQVDCYQSHDCDNSGSSANNMKCSSASGSCTSGTTNCAECDDDGTIGSVQKLWTYTCDDP